MIFNPRGLPWTVGLSFGWTVVLALFSGGALFLALGLYLAYWVRTRRGRSAAFWCYVTTTVLVILMLVPKTFPVPYMEAIETGGLVLLVATPLVLRAEIISLYRRSHGVSLKINPLLTVLFSSVYLNRHILDLPITPSATITPQEPKPAGSSASSREG